MPPPKAAGSGQLYGLSQFATPEMALVFRVQGTKFGIPNALEALVTSREVLVLRPATPGDRPFSYW
jgi:hypothetical protein